jgi:two-component system, NarL family, sensor kinase
MATNTTEQVEALQRSLDDATRRAESLRRVIESISGELALEPLLTRIIECAVELIGADDGAIGLVIEKDGGPVVRSIAAYNMPQIEPGQEIGPGVGLAGQVLLEQRPIRLDRYSDLTNTALPEPDDYAVIGMPIWWAGTMIGYFGIGAAPPRRFTDRDVETLELFARHAAVAIENARRYEAERWRTEQLALIARIGRTLTADMPLDDLLRSAADSIHEQLGYPNVAIPLIDPLEPTTLVISIFGGLYRTMVGGVHRLPISEGIMGAAVRTRQMQLVNDVAADPRYITPPGAVGIRAELAVPIISGDQVLGVLNVERADPFSDEEATSLQVVADQLAVAIENVRLAERGQQLAVLEERRRLARELHDSVTQSLFSMSLLAQVLPDLWDVDQDEARAALGQIRDLTRGALAEMRALLFELRPVALGEQGLAHALRERVAAFERQTGIRVTLELLGEPALPAPIEQAFFRIAQEALANVARHAQARQLRIALRGPAPVRLSIADDGQGFQPEQIQAGRFGLISMRERATQTGARLQIRSAIGQGTEIVVEWPDPGPSADQQA